MITYFYHRKIQKSNKKEIGLKIGEEYLNQL